MSVSSSYFTLISTLVRGNRAEQRGRKANWALSPMSHPVLRAQQHKATGSQLPATSCASHWSLLRAPRCAQSVEL